MADNFHRDPRRIRGPEEFPILQKTTRVAVKRLPNGTGVALPTKMSRLAAGLDLHAAVSQPTTLQPRDIRLIPCGFAMALEPGYEAQIRPRSGLAVKHGISLVNTPGTIDADYRGEVKVILVNLGAEPFVVRRGERIAQFVAAKVTRARLVVVDSVADTARGAGGFGSTGSAG